MAAKRDKTAEDYRRLFYFAFNMYPEQMQIIPLSSSGILMDAARANDKRPAYLRLATSDDMVKNLKGEDSLRDEVFILRIPRYVVDREDSPVVLPTEVKK